MAWHDTELASYITETVPIDSFAKIHQEILLWLKSCADRNERPNDLNAAKELSEPAFDELSRILLFRIDEREENDIDAFEDSIKALRRIRLQKKHSELLAQVEEYMESGNPNYLEKLRESIKVKDEIDDL